jgi:hypothetical protein
VRAPPRIAGGAPGPRGQQPRPAGYLVDGIRLSANPGGGAAAKEVRLCTLLCPPGIKADAKKAMMQQVSADIAEAYPGEGHTWVVHREDDPSSAMLNGGLMSEKYR